MAVHKTAVVKAYTPTVNATNPGLTRLTDTLKNIDPVNGLIDPPYSLKRLSSITELSGCLNQYIDAIITNVDEFGWKYDPCIRLESPNIETLVKEQIYSERIIDVNGDPAEVNSIDEPTSAEVKARIKTLKWTATYEVNKLKTFFFACNPEGSFISLRSKTRKDLESTGNAFWEILRDQSGKIVNIVKPITANIRLAPIDKVGVEVNEQVPKTDISWTTIKQIKYFRRFAEVTTDNKTVKVWFKEFGDPRIVSRVTGKIYNSLEEFNSDKDRKPNDSPATEILHFSIYSSDTFPYGSPRWIGNLPAVLGSRELDEVNLGYFENKTVPPLALLVSGGRLSKGVVPRIEEFIEQNVKGKKNFHKILVLEAEGQKGANGVTTAVPTVKFVPLREAQQQDALFQNYDDANWEKIGSSFRLPRILVGKDRAINRATAMASLQFAEEQVFEPIRNTFDEIINRNIFPALNITFWKFRSNTPITRDPELLANIIQIMSEVGIITPAEGRALASDVFNKEFTPLDEDWTKQPFKLTLTEAAGTKSFPSGEVQTTQSDSKSSKTSESNNQDQSSVDNKNSSVKDNTKKTIGWELPELGGINE